jgi:exodeoxyribonuclease-1
MAATIYWHDYEAWGADPRRDRASQFAGVRTDLDLNEVDQALVIYCQPTADRLPHPKACLITGIIPTLAQQRGLSEAEFIRQIHEQFSKGQTCVAGYNSIRFDDELSRQLLYRNFYDPYEREWKNGNSRWDIIDTLRLCHALRPEGINWPRLDDGSPVFKLGALTSSNGLIHESAHDALSDVRATIALARLMKTAQPRFFQYAFDLRSKTRVQAMIDLTSQKPFLHASSVYPARNSCLALVMPLAAHPQENNGILIYDLAVDPTPWLAMNATELAQSLFVAKKDLREGESRLPVSVLHTNRCPAIAPISVMDDQLKLQSVIDWNKSRKHWDLLHSNGKFLQELLLALEQRSQQKESVFEKETVTDPDEQIYTGGFFSDADKRIMNNIRAMSSTELATQHDQLCLQFKDKRLPEMLFRYRARNFLGSLNSAEITRWQNYCRHECLNTEHRDENDTLNLLLCRNQIEHERAQNPSPEDLQVLERLEGYLLTLEKWVDNKVD